MRRLSHSPLPATLSAAFLLLLACSLSARAADEQEAWDAIFIGAQKVGHTHIRVSPVSDAKGRSLYRVQVNTVLSFMRAADRVNMEVRYGTIETPEGGVLRLDTRTLAGEEELRTYGDAVNGVMNLILEGGGQRQETPVPWSDDVRGPYAAELSLSRQPIKPGETRSLKIFIPDFNKVCDSALKAISSEEVVLGGGVKRQLLRIEQTIAGPDAKRMPELDATLWVDEGGQVLKSRAALLGGMESYRTTREAALAPNGEFDLLTATIVKLAQPISSPDKRTDILYKITIEGVDPAEVFPADSRQSLTKSNAPDSAQLRVVSAGNLPAPESPSAEPEALAPNPLINSDNPTVRDHTRKAVGNQTDPWAKAVAIQEWIFKNLRKKNFSNAFASAGEVARNLEGDCSEHSVLTAAMCRSAGVPCRVVVGLVYAEPLGGFGPHAWNEVFVNGRWVAIDSAFNQSKVDATHLKMASSSLDGVAPFEAFLPIVRVINKLKIDTIEIR